MRNWDDWAQALKGEKIMYKHTLKFASLVDKQDALDYVLEGHVQFVGDVDECLTQKQVSFLTDIELTSNERRNLLTETGAISHIEEEI